MTALKHLDASGREVLQRLRLETPVPSIIESLSQDLQNVSPRLVQLLTSRNDTLREFWSSLCGNNELQKKFIHFLEFDIRIWYFKKNRYVESKSATIKTINKLSSDLRRARATLKSNPTVESMATGVITKLLEERHLSVFDELHNSWNAWDDKPLTLPRIIDEVIKESLKRIEMLESFVTWHPTKIAAASSTKVFLIRSLYRNLKRVSYSGPLYGLIALMASDILVENITDEDVRKNLGDRKILENKLQNLPV